MLDAISWNVFLLFAVVGTGLYYLILFIKFRPGLPGFFNYKKGDAVLSKNQQPDNYESIEALQQDAGPNLYQQAKDLRTELIAIIQTAALKQLAKEELLIVIQLKIQPYAQLKLTPFRAALNNFIEAECAEHCSVHIDRKDLEFIWL